MNLEVDSVHFFSKFEIARVIWFLLLSKPISQWDPSKDPSTLAFRRDKMTIMKRLWCVRAHDAWAQPGAPCSFLGMIHGGALNSPVRKSTLKSIENNSPKSWPDQFICFDINSSFRLGFLDWPVFWSCRTSVDLCVCVDRVGGGTGAGSTYKDLPRDVPPGIFPSF